MLRGLFGGFFVWFGLGFVLRVLTLRCALIAAFTDKVNNYFLVFYGVARTAQFFPLHSWPHNPIRDLQGEVLKNLSDHGKNLTTNGHE